MKDIIFIWILISLVGCSSAQSNEKLNIERVVIDSSDAEYGYYLKVKPKGEIKSVLVLLPGFGQKSEDVFLDTKFHELAYERNILVIGFAGRMKLTADSAMQDKLNLVFNHIIRDIKIEKDRFVIGGFSAGGVIALRFTELCHQFPDKFPIKPVGIFMADSPVDLFHSWKLQEENLKNNYSEISVNEATWLTRFYREFYGATPSENPEIYMALSPFSIDENFGNNELYLKTVAVRAYHDIDVEWRLKNRNQTAKYDNYIATSELINRLMLMGNEKAEFIQTFKTGYRRNGERHPHSWSIIYEKECIDWMLKLVD